MENYNVLIIYAQLASDAEHILKVADQTMRRSWNLYGFKRIGSGCQTITTDGFGNPYNDERELRLFGIAVKIPEHMGLGAILAYVDCGIAKVGCYSEIHYLSI